MRSFFVNGAKATIAAIIIAVSSALPLPTKSKMSFKQVRMNRVHRHVVVIITMLSAYKFRSPFIILSHGKTWILL
jgi:hypothetical protein